jgi:hypothetical protein
VRRKRRTALLGVESPGGGGKSLLSLGYDFIERCRGDVRVLARDNLGETEVVLNESCLLIHPV